MSIRVDVKKFARIEKATIKLGDFSLFVGDNNSGKTLMMELIYGIINLISEWSVEIGCAQSTEAEDVSYIRFSGEWFTEMEKHINSYLRDYKRSFLLECFSVEVPAEEITIHFEVAEKEFYVGTIAETAYLEKEYADGGRVNIADNVMGTVEEMKLQLARYALLDMLGLPVGKGQLFLPAARAGLQMLYRSFFANRQGKSGMTLPIYDYLKFLQTYSPRVQFDEKEKDLIKFVDRELLGGKVEYQNDMFMYRETDCYIPLNMASSMIHELSSFSSVLKSECSYGYLYYDEAENSVHPIKQGSVAKALIRFCNLDNKVIVSTHSDTLAGRLNNLILVSKMQNVIPKNDILEKLDWSVQDMLQPDKTVYIYEFKKNEKGSVIIEELEFLDYPKIGYDFGRFNENIDMLYDESNCIMG
ncbi:MAG: ATP-binding protein [Candidatus Gastranaerophilales bacterium]|nr:ATP-binding protein [Candidatus Gastranaerophilales bacterium]